MKGDEIEGLEARRESSRNWEGKKREKVGVGGKIDKGDEIRVLDRRARVGSESESQSGRRKEERERVKIGGR